jgi:Spy/CpxP family protein refolding chaperone
MLERLGLRPEQEAQVEADRETLHAEMMELREALAAESAVLADLMVADEPDREAIAAQVGTLAELHRQKHQLIVEHFLRVNELLDDQQREVFKETVGKVVAKCGAGPRGFGRHHRGHGRHGPPGKGRGRGFNRN